MGVGALLVFVIILSVRQYQHTERYNSIITQSEQMIFQFSTIREQITTSLIAQDWEKTVSAADQLKELNSTLARLQESPLIPGDSRLDMAKQVDLAGLVIAAKAILTSTDKLGHSLALQTRLRKLAEYLIQFDRIIVSQMRAKVVQFQAVMIGALGMVICLISFSLILLYKKSMLPLLRLSEQTEDPDIVSTGFKYDNDAWAEVARFIDLVNDLFRKIDQPADQAAQAQPHNEQLAAIINESTNLANGIINYAQLLADSCHEMNIGSEESKMLEEIMDAADRIAQLNKEI